MKKYVIATLIIVSLNLNTEAQVSVGFKAGSHWNTATVKTPDGRKPSVNAGMGYHGGLQLRVQFEKNLSFLPQIQYAYKKFEINYNNGDTSRNQLRYHYLEIPVLFEWSKTGMTSGFFFQFGPSFSIAMGGNEVITTKSGTSISNPIKFAFSAYGRFEANFVGNLGYQFNRHFQLSAGYAHGLGTLIDDDFGPEIKTRMLTASLHYFID